MSIPDSDIDEPDNGERACSIHGQYYWRCPECAADEMDQLYDSLKEERETNP